MKNLLFIFTLAFLYPLVYAKNSSTHTKVEQLIQLIKQREAVMKDVAAFKFSRNISPYDANRELAVLENISKQAGSTKNNMSVLIYSQILMDISKQIEAYWLQHWTIDNISPIARNNLNQVRHIITETDKKMTILIMHIKADSQTISRKRIAALVNQEFNLEGVPVLYKKLLAYELSYMLLK